MKWEKNIIFLALLVPKNTPPDPLVKIFTLSYIFPHFFLWSKTVFLYTETPNNQQFSYPVT